MGSGDANEVESTISDLTEDSLWKDLQICHSLDIEKC